MLVFEEELRKVHNTSTDFFCFLSEDWGVLKNDMYVEGERDKAFRTQLR